MTFGEEGKEQARVHNLEDVKEILDIFQSHGHYEVCIGRLSLVRINQDSPNRSTRQESTVEEPVKNTSANSVGNREDWLWIRSLLQER
jgi:hypothetical protein